MSEKIRPEDKIVDGLLALGNIAMGIQEYVSEKVSERVSCNCRRGESGGDDLKKIIQEEIRAYLGKHNFVTEEELAALRKVVNQMKNAQKPKKKQ